ncbi:MAG: transcriptional regulator [Pseudonocardia sp. SCN 72-86]|nr:MAG: transcriptional regulator [Pseudonocardia sp. SCN 72-86]
MPDAGAALEALGDPSRRAIVELLGGGPRPVGEIAAALPISRPAVSRHLRLLKEAGLVDDDARGTRRVYHLRADGVEAIRAYFHTVWGDAAGRFRLVAENTRPGTGKDQP